MGCITAGQYDPNDENSKLYRCDFYNNKDAGALLERMLMEGGGRKWQEVLKEFLCDENDDECTGELSGVALLKYFKPLETWLDEQAAEHEYSITWDEGSEWTPKGYENFPEETSAGNSGT